MDRYRAALEAVRMVSLLAGSVVIFLGILRATPEAIGAGGRVARRIGDHASFGLEFFVAATILNLILDPTWTAVAVTAATITIRQLLTLSLRSARF
ncbi:MAG TPA: DUF1622 domain-containing protein [Rubrobacteraceae bacterium]|nr:DUF1622 domain-containing protein [Rubrobacteraceae bacterium]